MRLPSDLPPRNTDLLLEQALCDWGGEDDLWVFGYGSLLWRPEFDYAERRPAHVHGWHRALRMWSHVHRGTPECPGLVLGMISGGSCRGMVFRVPRDQAPAVMRALWQREMATSAYDPRWLRCRTESGCVQALGFTLSRESPDHAGELPEDEYRRIFSQAAGCFGTTLDYARSTYDELRRLGIHDRALGRLLALSASSGGAQSRA
ncbi:gamma-glutamylcyclotransferase [Xylophilus sp.]|uniref:gamma-glutamylcyclotransferase n=1 Tax=Xylophilus sp. TaxID=2653893 RepID=UPI0013BD634B|nr:gamma-glutamylcyclotransferase [Xylophilus sp.]KAF1044199.1 MAG: Glutathione-specific gamma-glutamylcyclotransferase [Xylophilus sp.]